MAWVWIWIAAVCEVTWAIGLKMSASFTKPGPSVVTGIAYLASLGFLALGLRTLPVGTAYAVWTGIGAAGAFILGIVFLGEAATLLRIGSAALIVAGIIGLKLASDA